MQAKRAAYTGQRSYTLEGTPILVKDAHLDTKGRPARIEAYWVPQGASCVNMDNRRRPEGSGSPRMPACRHAPLPMRRKTGS